MRLSKAAAAYHPGRGVYRSSYKNVHAREKKMQKKEITKLQSNYR